MLAMNDNAVLQVLRGAWIAGKPRSYRNSACPAFVGARLARDDSLENAPQARR
ncbi:hypothetical protein C4K26_4837 [Pseudomonas chlororaphis]|nr:hypothetical protein C4K26_4837 [Pseudomonas chlororaphis]